ncbi:hypothetical protein TanjilG_28953 [Lupinus angustifolius]|uniref:Uncharacterized protein n=1 Tax=Lupinus angustifolius TaxID=3871 RepID=A0A4P1RTA1_LUPAN|nr:PREDICTED: uncharacterized protein LOC109340784 [Lupinus angustifolius]OIW17603.1 hypothetical protein TanjilG_28953 [Lupinus angustifolius]
MSVNPMSDAKTPPLTQPPPPPQPQLKLQPQTNQPSLSDYGLSVGHGGSRFVDSGSNSATSFNSLSLGSMTAQTNYYPRFRKSKVSFLLPVEVNKGSNSNDNGGEGDKKEEVLGDEEEETNLMLKNLDNKKEEGEGKKKFNLRPRKEKKVVNSRTQINVAAKGSRNGATRVTRQTCKLPEIPTRLRTQTRSRTANNATGSASTVFSLTLTKKEIESDFLKMTGELPPKKPLRRPRNVQNQIDAIFPGMFLDTITAETYKIPDPPLKI